MQNFVMKFGKYKGQKFLNTPKSYQEWLLKQDWFKVPVERNQFEEGQKRLSELSGKLKGWNGYSAKGQAVYEQMFEAEMMIEDALYCNCGNRKDVNEKDCGCGIGSGMWYC